MNTIKHWKATSENKLKFRGIIGDSSYEQQNFIPLKKRELVNGVNISEDFPKEKQDSNGNERQQTINDLNKESNIEDSNSSEGINSEEGEKDSKAKAKTNS
jgi:hypothetical protein